MSKASWCTVSPSSGTGNKTVSVSGTAHTGRVQRETTLTVKTTTGSPVQTKTVDVIQSPKAEFVSGKNAYSATATATTVAISGTSNSSKLTFTFSGIVTAVSNFKVNEVSATSGTAIVGDPGADAEFAWTATATISVNSTISSRTGTVTITCNDTAKTLIATITQAAGAATLTVSKTSITLAQAGTAVTFDVTSNASWSIS
jgi:hypothetical protein